MDNVTLERAVEVVRALGPEEQTRLRALMDAWMKDSRRPVEPRPAPPETTPAQERAYLEHLLAKGVIAFIPERYQEGYVPEDSRERRPPLIVEGEPVSETVLRERR